jgi:signal transduction histidine kinase/FixJ family two-component response regulator
VTRLNDRLLGAYEELGRAHKQLKAENMRELKKLNQSLSLTNNKLQAEVGERMDAERKLQEAARRKDEFIAILAHELRNPLSAIQSGVEVMRLPSLPEDKVEWAQNLVQRQVEHLVRLIDDLLDVSRVTSGRVQLRREVIDLRQVVENSIDSMRARIEERKHSLTVDLPDEPLRIDGDAVRLGQVFANLLGNAAKYMERGGKISVSAGPDSNDAGRAVARVTDAGSGLPRDMLEHVFELFAQAQPAGGRTQSGLGIGLALARRLVELHGGRIRAESEGTDKGSTFTVELPLTDASPSTVTPKLERNAPCPLRLLVIDDNVDAAAALAHLLNQLTSHEVRVAHDGIGGIEMAVEFRPDVVFLDIGLPDIDGYEVARQLSERPELDHTRIVALTGFGAEQARARRAEGYFYRFLTKPIAFFDLESVLSQAAERKDCLGEAKQAPTDSAARSRRAGSSLA